MKSSKEQAGSLLIVISIIAVALVLGALGYVAWAHYSQQDTSDAQSEQSTSVKTDEVESTYELTDAQEEIRALLIHESLCDQTILIQDYTIVPSAGYDANQKGSLISDSLEYAAITYGCGTQGNVAYVKRVDNKWALVASSLEYPWCDKVLAAGFPQAVAYTCYEER